MSHLQAGTLGVLGFSHSDNKSSLKYHFCHLSSRDEEFHGIAGLFPASGLLPLPCLPPVHLPLPGPLTIRSHPLNPCSGITNPHGPFPGEEREPPTGFCSPQLQASPGLSGCGFPGLPVGDDGEEWPRV